MRNCCYRNCYGTLNRALHEVNRARIVHMSAQADTEAAVPQCMNWSVEEVSDWVQSLGFPQYRVRSSVLYSHTCM